jgi:hypothetical protein
MGRYLVLFALSTTIVWANTKKNDSADLQIHLLPQETKGFESDHQNSGCPENSECDQVMGLQFKRWQNLLRNLQNKEKDSRKQAQFLQGFLDLYGIPTEFYTTLKSSQSFKPTYYNSPCREHNPKDKPQERILRGISFVKKTTSNSVVIWRDQAQLEIPFSDQMNLAPLDIYEEEGMKTYLVPLDEEPLYLLKDGPVFLKEDDGLFYALQIKNNGDWKVALVDFTNLSAFESKKKLVECGQNEKAPKLSGPFSTSICKEIWDQSAKKNRLVVLRRGCQF